MVENEKSECQKGSAERIKSLQELLPLAKMPDDIVGNAAGFVTSRQRTVESLI
jgi:hypothetical protein